MVTIEVDIVYNQIVRGTIMKTQKVDMYICCHLNILSATPVHLSVIAAICTNRDLI